MRKQHRLFTDFSISSFIFHHSSLPRKHCFTLIELLVVIGIMAILMLISSSVTVKAKKSIVSQYHKIMPPSNLGLEDTKKEEKGPAREEGTNVKAGKLTTLKDAGSGKARVRKKGPAQSGGKDVPGEKSGSEKAGETTGKEPAAEAEDGIVFPEPTGIIPGKMKVTVINLASSETEPFAKFLFAKGSNSSLADYRKELSFDINKLKWKWSLKLDNDIKVSPYDQAIRDETVYLTSPYRTYLLRKRLLNASRLTFDSKKSKAKHRKIAEEKFQLTRYKKTVELDLPSGKVSGLYKGVRGKSVIIGMKRIRLSEIPEDQLWRFDQGALDKKITEFAEQAALDEERAMNIKQDEYIQKTLAAEFPMLYGDFWMKNILEKKK